MRGMESCTIDVHTHVLPGMDDGAKDVQMSLRMLEMMAAQGTCVVCATPHYHAKHESITAFLDRREKAMDQLLPRLPHGIQKIIPGAEVAFSFRISENKNLDALCFGQTKTLLLEMPFSDWSQYQIEEVISLVLDREFQVVLAHPERFLFSAGNREFLRKLAELSVAFQINADTLCHWRSRKKGLELLQMTEMPLLGSDGHNITTRKPDMGQGREMIQKHLGALFLDQVDHTAFQLVNG